MLDRRFMIGGTGVGRLARFGVNPHGQGSAPVGPTLLPYLKESGVATSGLVLCLNPGQPMDDAKQIMDEASGLHATVTGVSTGFDRANGAVYTATEDQVVWEIPGLAGNDALDFSSAFTVQMVVALDNSAGYTDLFNRSDASDNRRYSLRYSDVDVYQFHHLKSDGTLAGVNTSAKPLFAQWSVITWMFDAGNAQVRNNKDTTATTYAMPNPLTGVGGRVIIGGWRTAAGVNSDAYHGQIAYVLAYNRKLTDAEQSSNYTKMRDYAVARNHQAQHLAV